MRRFQSHRGDGAYPRPWRSPSAYLQSDDGPRWSAIRRADGRLSRIPIVLGLITLAILGVFIARDRGEQRPALARPADTRNDALELSPVQGWTPTTKAPRLAGMEFENPVVLTERVSGVQVVAGLLPATSPTLLPSTFVRQLNAPVANPTTEVLGRGLKAYHFTGLSPANSSSIVDVFVVPTTVGVATVACVAGRGIIAPYGSCLQMATTLKLRAGRALRLGPDAAFRQRLPGAVAALDQGRRRARAELARHVPAQQAAAAAKLAATFRAQAASLTPLAPTSRPWARVLVRELGAAGRAYGDVATALRNTDEDAFRVGQDAVHARERRIRQLLDLRAGE
jgi:hypothetical protein